MITTPLPSTFYLASKTETVFNDSDIDDIFESIFSTIVLNTQESLGKGLGWIIGSVVDRAINISRHNPLAGSSYLKLPKYFNYPRKF